MSGDDHERGCPLAAVDSRLSDVHRQWHEAERSYFNPEAFRAAIQSAIQTLRTVTFILQSNRRYIPDFTGWYQEWQDRLRSDLLMRWMVDARNKIEKQGDLETNSFVSAEIVASYLEEGPSVQVPAELWDAPLELQRRIPQNELGEHLRRHGILRIRRRWVENTLPEHELLDAVAIAYGRVSELVDDAHRQAGLSAPVTINEETGEAFPKEFRGGRLPCMIGHEDARTRNIDLSDGRPMTLVEEAVPFDREIAQEYVERVGVDPAETFSSDGSSRDIIDTLFSTVRRVFEADGTHVTICFLFRSGRPVDIVGLAPGDQGEKYLLMRSVARRVTECGADTAVLVSEAWSAPFDPSRPYQRPADSPVREEHLVATLARAEGEPIQLRARIIRDGDSVSLDETQTTDGGRHFAFAPLYKAWGRPIPDEWSSYPEVDEAG